MVTNVSVGDEAHSKCKCSALVQLHVLANADKRIPASFCSVKTLLLDYCLESLSTFIKCPGEIGQISLKRGLEGTTLLLPL